MLQLLVRWTMVLVMTVVSACGGLAPRATQTERPVENENVVTFSYPHHADLPGALAIRDAYAVEDGGLVLAANSETGPDYLVRLSGTGELLWFEALPKETHLTEIKNLSALGGDRYVMQRILYWGELERSYEILMVGDGEHRIIPIESQEGWILYGEVFGAEDGFYWTASQMNFDIQQSRPKRLTRFDAAGEVVYEMKLPEGTQIEHVIGLPDGALLIGAMPDPLDTAWFPRELGACIRLDAEGETLWEAHTERYDMDTTLSACEVLEDGSFLLAGNQARAWADERGFTACPSIAVRISPDGDMLWAREFQTTDDDFEGNFNGTINWLRTSDGMIVRERLTGTEWLIRLSRIDEEGRLLAEKVTLDEGGLPFLLLRDDNLYAMELGLFSPGVPLRMVPVEWS